MQNARKILMPLFGEFSRSSWDLCESDYDLDKSHDDGLNSPKSGMWIFFVLRMEMTVCSGWGGGARNVGET